MSPPYFVRCCPCGLTYISRRNNGSQPSPAQQSATSHSYPPNGMPVWAQPVSSQPNAYPLDPYFPTSYAQRVQHLRPATQLYPQTGQRPPDVVHPSPSTAIYPSAPPQMGQGPGVSPQLPPLHPTAEKSTAFVPQTGYMSQSALAHRHAQSLNQQSHDSRQIGSQHTNVQQNHRLGSHLLTPTPQASHETSDQHNSAQRAQSSTGSDRRLDNENSMSVGPVSSFADSVRPTQFQVHNAPSQSAPPMPTSVPSASDGPSSVLTNSRYVITSICESIDTHSDTKRAQHSFSIQVAGSTCPSYHQ
jgi:hypothetical protein